MKDVRKIYWSKVSLSKNSLLGYCVIHVMLYRQVQVCGISLKGILQYFPCVREDTTTSPSIIKKDTP